MFVNSVPPRSGPGLARVVSVPVSAVEEQRVQPGRVRKFDRPPPPHDWRWWVGGLGKTLIAAGLLMFGFVAYQLWGTGIETARSQNSLESEFQDLLAGTPPTTVAPTETAPVDTAPVDNTVPDTPATTAPPSVATLPPIAEGDPIARIEMPTLGVDKIVVAGVAKTDLKKGPGHYPETPMPGQLGNAAIAGHRTTFGQPFYDVDKLAVGDEIILTTLEGRFVYRVTGKSIVSPSDYQVIATSDPTRATLTLTSCHPKYTARERIIITAELDVEASSGPAGDPVLNYGRPLDGGSDTAASADPTSTITDPQGSVVDSTPQVVEDPTVATPNPGVGSQQISDGIADAFAEGWFSDPTANSQVALWGLLLAAIGIVSYLISKKAKRDWVGMLVGIVPFVVVLYFFFQNVNRLLPPNL